jgi:hypothetical protein
MDILTVGLLPSPDQVAASCVERLASTLLGRSTPGLISAGRTARARHLGQMLVADPRPRGQKPPRKVARSTCSQLHPGYCVTRDAALSTLITHIARSLTQYWTRTTRAKAVGQFFLAHIMGPGETPLGTRAVMLCSVRFARPAGQVYAMYACEKLPPGEGADEFRLSRVQRAENDAGSHFVHTHELVKLILSDAAWSTHPHEELQVHWRRLEDGPLLSMSMRHLPPNPNPNPNLTPNPDLGTDLLVQDRGGGEVKGRGRGEGPGRCPALGNMSHVVNRRKPLAKCVANSAPVASGFRHGGTRAAGEGHPHAVGAVCRR